MSSRASRKKRSFKMRPVLWRWHRRIGLVVALLTLLVSVTGIQLNHIDTLAWDKKPLRSALLLSLYGVEKPEVRSYQVADTWFSHLGGDQLYMGTAAVASCHGPLAGVVAYQQFIVAACVDELILLTSQGELIERIGSVYKLPQPITALGRCGADTPLCLQVGDKYHQANIDQLRWPALLDATFEAAPLASLPSKVREPLLAEHYSGGITWERVVLDLHSGRLFGMGPWLMDAAAVLLILLALSGFWLWAEGFTKKRKPR